jgi:hypothetical protein
MTKVQVPLQRVLNAYYKCPNEVMYRITVRAHMSEFLDVADVLQIESVECGKVRFLGRSNGYPNRQLRHEATGSNRSLL